MNDNNNNILVINGMKKIRESNAIVKGNREEQFPSVVPKCAPGRLTFGANGKLFKGEDIQNI